ncbi:MAG: amidase [Clostridia bacterium]|nr:amidase [Clostridia bacterium]
MMNQEMTIAKFHEALLAGKTTVKELVEYYLDRIEKVDPIIKAVISINKDVIKDAQKLDEYFKNNGLIGPLHGVPILVKDNMETIENATTAGSLSLKDHVPHRDAYIIEKLRAAGGLVIAKTNLHEFAIWGETISSILGQTLNPYDLTRTPGGSSGGTGAGLAADFALIGLGSDTINSVRSPASANNLVGIRPTIGVVSRSGIVPYSYTQDTAGPLARTVEDAVLCLDAMKGYDKDDESTAWYFKNQNETLKSHLDPEGLKDKRIGVLRELFGANEVHLDTTNAVLRAVNQMRSGGAVIIDIDDIFDTGALVNEVSVHLHDFKDHLNSYLATIPDTLPCKNMQEIVDSGLHHPGVKDNMMTALSLSTDTDEYRMRLVKRTQLQNKVMKLMADYDLDALVYPHQKQLVCEVGSSQNERNGVVASVTGFPSICVPAGFSTPDDNAPIGVPIGMEIMGRPFSEGILIEIAYAYEQRANMRKVPVGLQN